MKPTQLKEHPFEPDADLLGAKNGVKLDEKTADLPDEQATAEIKNTDEVVDTQPPTAKRGKWLLAVSAIALTIGAVTGWRWWQFQQTHLTTENAQIQGHASPISAKIPATIQQVLVRAC